MSIGAHRQGQVALSLILMIGGIMIIVGATLAFVVVTFLNSTYGYRDSNQALALAESGVQDAIIQLERNNQFASTGYCVPDISCSAPSATVTVTQNSPATNEATIVSSAVSSNRQRKVQAIVSVVGNGQVSLLSWQILQ